MVGTRSPHYQLDAFVLFFLSILHLDGARPRLKKKARTSACSARFFCRISCAVTQPEPEPSITRSKPSITGSKANIRGNDPSITGSTSLNSVLRMLSSP